MSSRATIDSNEGEVEYHLHYDVISETYRIIVPASSLVSFDAKADEAIIDLPDELCKKLGIKAPGGMDE